MKSTLPLYVIALTAAFVALDVAGEINWYWWQITLPLLATLGLGLVGAIVRGLSSSAKR